MVCECTGCCGFAFEDFPDFIYARLTWNSDNETLDVYTKMYKRLNSEYKSNPCKCLNCHSSILYESDAITTALAGNNMSERVCCAGFTLQGECTEDIGDPGGVHGDCEWFLSTSWMRACDFPGVPVTLSCLVEGSVGLPLSTGDMEGCLDQNADNSDRSNADVTFSQSLPGGTEATQCNKLCCPDLPVTLYVTLESNCPALDGMVIPVTRGYFSCASPPGVTTHNTTGANGLDWWGKIKLCGANGLCGNHYEVRVSTNTYSTNPQCNWSVAIGRSVPGYDDCYYDIVTEFDNEFCLPVTFAELPWGNDSDDRLEYCHYDCCPSTEDITVTATVSE